VYGARGSEKTTTLTRNSLQKRSGVLSWPIMSSHADSAGEMIAEVTKAKWETSFCEWALVAELSPVSGIEEAVASTSTHRPSWSWVRSH
jgi:hypothetical protein